MIPAIGLADAWSIVSPIDGKQIHGRSEYMAHMKKHNVLPQSELAGEAAHRQAQMKKDEATQRRAEITKIVAAADIKS